MLQPGDGSPLLEFVDRSPQLFGILVLQCLTIVELQQLSLSCKLLQRITRQQALAAEIQVHAHQRVELELRHTQPPVLVLYYACLEKGLRCPMQSAMQKPTAAQQATRSQQEELLQIYNLVHVSSMAVPAACTQHFSMLLLDRRI